MKVLEVITQRGISVKKTGSVFVAICPFHNDTNPSLVIFPKTDSWYCFSCCFGGDASDFVARYENIPKEEARKRLKREKENNVDSSYYKENFLLDVFSDTLYAQRKERSFLELVALSKKFDLLINEKRYEEALEFLRNIARGGTNEN